MMCSCFMDGAKGVADMFNEHVILSGPPEADRPVTRGELREIMRLMRESAYHAITIPPESKIAYQGALLDMAFNIDLVIGNGAK